MDILCSAVKEEKNKITCNFIKCAHWTIQLRDNAKILIVNKESCEESCVSKDKKVYKRIEQNDHFNDSCNRGIAALFNSNIILKVQNKEKQNNIEMLPEEMRILNEIEFCIRDCAMNQAA